MSALIGLARALIAARDTLLSDWPELRPEVVKAATCPNGRKLEGELGTVEHAVAALRGDAQARTLESSGWQLARVRERLTAFDGEAILAELAAERAMTQRWDALVRRANALASQALGERNRLCFGERIDDAFAPNAKAILAAQATYADALSDRAEGILYHLRMVEDLRKQVETREAAPSDVDEAFAALDACAADTSECDAARAVLHAAMGVSA